MHTHHFSYPIKDYEVPQDQYSIYRWPGERTAHMMHELEKMYNLCYTGSNINL